MHIIPSRTNLSKICADFKQQGLSIGFVPTMGALHDGHLSLVNACRNLNDITVVSIFVNPTQFNKKEDLDHYPRTLEADLKMLEKEGCDIVFTPTEDEMYASKSVVHLNFGYLENTMEGANRPGHFNGVGLIVSKLFHAVQPDDAFFGQKDFQQLAIIKRLVSDLGFGIRIHSCPTERESDGLAMSSRNQRLTAADRSKAPILYQTLTEASQLLRDNKPPYEVAEVLTTKLSDMGVNVEYLDIVHPDTLQKVEIINETDELAVCIAAHFGNVRLIDNILVRIK